ncbi:MAG TPA: phytanoyl-CoA dioxygenase family protein [Rhodopila sp.]|uniref:phytanoyl-CoA dioxygenase family protein n=1 Tax=Rhodopila sp. TaxID=2480087 RepID=UPI002B6BDAF9|nr:phytanoyl-CoA dioxygenase family protein [Rhodopila sp.]HVY17498.1 phytanoyl-CoA dioxygenase family protein [Rhodopila sp.]
MNEIGRIGYGPEEAAMQAYLEAGAERARTLGNRGPIRFTEDGRVHPDILDAYWRTGFYVFENVVDQEELADIEAGMKDVLSRLPVAQGAEVDAEGRPALGLGLKAPTLFWSKPLGDPVGGTSENKGRHPVKMFEPTPDAAAPKEIVYLILGSLQFADAALRLYGHPKLLAVAAGVNGDDFVPFNESLFIKEPGRGASVAWHQDGVTHWNSPDWDMGSHGFNFMAQLYGCTPANGVWVVPGSHRRGKADIKAMVAAAGTERLPDAVPIVCAPGDVAMTNRQAVHGSFANTSTQWRITLNQGFHRRRSILGVESGGVYRSACNYDADFIRRRARLIGYAIDARRQRYPDEAAYAYAPLAGETYRWDDAAKADIRDYHLEDLSI